MARCPGRRVGDQMEFKMMPIERFFAKVDKQSSCWIWNGARKPSGYGNFYMDGKYFGAHCASFILHKGKISKGLFVCHTCDNPSCVNPEHLFLGSPAQNIQDCVKKQRARRGWKVDNLQVIQIRKMRKEGALLREIALIFGITEANVSLICSSKQKHRVNIAYLSPNER